MNYDYGSKRHWRRWLWNRIAERVDNRGEAIVLYLPGEDAHDIEEAKKKGFRARNMIAVDRDASIVEAIRSRGHLAINSNLNDVMHAWPAHRPVQVILADLCCGLTNETLLLRLLAQREAFLDGVIAVNMLRGRDAASNSLRQLAVDHISGLDPKNRAHHFWLQYIAPIICWSEDGEPPSLDVQIKRSDIVHKLCEPATYSYRSTAGAQVFDSVVFNSWRKAFGDLSFNAKEPASPKPLDGLRRQIAAVLAHHTRRK